MTNRKDARAIVEALNERASKDEKLSKLLEEIQRALGSESFDDEDGNKSRARLPYSSEPPYFETIWN